MGRDVRLFSGALFIDGSAVHEVEPSCLADEPENNNGAEGFADMKTHKYMSKGPIDAPETVGV
jgi:hypothetical protein